jgi:hypothetical protein
MLEVDAMKRAGWNVNRVASASQNAHSYQSRIPDSRSLNPVSSSSLVYGIAEHRKPHFYGGHHEEIHPCIRHPWRGEPCCAARLHPARVLAARLVDVSVVNRSTGERLTPWRHGGKLYVAGTPGDRYAVELRSRRGERVLTVLSVDGVNVLTGQTAATLQSGYVLDGWQSYSINGWRKSMEDVAQFVFTALPDSYAVRTGRPGNVGVIGVAVYREKPAAPEPMAVAPQAPSWRDGFGRNEAQTSSAAADSAAKAESQPGRSAGAEGNRPASALALAERRADQAGSLAESLR